MIGPPTTAAAWRNMVERAVRQHAIGRRDARVVSVPADKRKVSFDARMMRNVMKGLR